MKIKNKKKKIMFLFIIQKKIMLKENHQINILNINLFENEALSLN